MTIRRSAPLLVLSLAISGCGQYPAQHPAQHPAERRAEAPRTATSLPADLCRTLGGPAVLDAYAPRARFRAKSEPVQGVPVATCIGFGSTAAEDRSVNVRLARHGASRACHEVIDPAWQARVDDHVSYARSRTDVPALGDVAHVDAAHFANGVARVTLLACRGGDELVLTVPRTPGESAIVRDDAVILAKRVFSAVTE